MLREYLDNVNQAKTTSRPYPAFLSICTQPMTATFPVRKPDRLATTCQSEQARRVPGRNVIDCTNIREASVVPCRISLHSQFINARAHPLEAMA
jgi:hypothetical protein